MTAASVTSASSGGSTESATVMVKPAACSAAPTENAAVSSVWSAPSSLMMMLRMLGAAFAAASGATNTAESGSTAARLHPMANIAAASRQLWKKLSGRRAIIEKAAGNQRLPAARLSTAARLRLGELRHPGGTAYRCSLPGLAEFHRRRPRRAQPSTPHRRMAIIPRTSSQLGTSHAFIITIVTCAQNFILQFCLQFWHRSLDHAA